MADDSQRTLSMAGNLGARKLSFFFLFFFKFQRNRGTASNLIFRFQPEILSFYISVVLSHRAVMEVLGEGYIFFTSKKTYLKAIYKHVSEKLNVDQECSLVVEELPSVHKVLSFAEHVLIPDWEAEADRSLGVQGLASLCSQFQATQGYIRRSCIKNNTRIQVQFPVL